MIDYRVKQLGPEGGKVLAVCLSSRRNMCIHERVMEEVRAGIVMSARRFTPLIGFVDYRLIDHYYVRTGLIHPNSTRRRRLHT